MKIVFVLVFYLHFNVLLYILIVFEFKGHYIHEVILINLYLPMHCAPFVNSPEVVFSLMRSLCFSSWCSLVSSRCVAVMASSSP